MDWDRIDAARRQARSIFAITFVVIGIAVFAALMALRHELSSVWARAAVAGCAFVILGWAVLMSRRP